MWIYLRLKYYNYCKKIPVGVYCVYLMTFQSAHQNVKLFFSLNRIAVIQI